MKQTPLHSWHARHGAKLVPFGGWDMPLHYGSQVQEHNAVREQVGMFDVSHMRAVDVSGDQATDFLRYLLANDVARLSDGKALYSCLLNEHGGILDDLIAYRTSFGYRLVVNAATADADVAWFLTQSSRFEVTISPRSDLALIAVQGPDALTRVATVTGHPVGDLRVFSSANFGELFVGRTGYTGEDGVEIIGDPAALTALWQQLADAGVTPCGLGARDTLRLEAGMALYGQDMNDQTRPVDRGLQWTVDLSSEREFIGRAACEQPQETRLIGVILEERGVLRSHQAVAFADGARGEITSGTYSPTLKMSIGLAVVPVAATGTCSVEIRGRTLPLKQVSYPFVRHGKAVFKSV